MAQYIVHPAEAGASAADRYGLAELQGLSEQTSNFVNNAALQLRLLQEQKSKTDMMRSLARLGINPMGGNAPISNEAAAKAADLFPEAGQDLALAQAGLSGMTVPYGRVLPSRLPPYALMRSWPYASAEQPTIPFGGVKQEEMPSPIDLQKLLYGK